MQDLPVPLIISSSAFFDIWFVKVDSSMLNTTAFQRRNNICMYTKNCDVNVRNEIDNECVER